MKSEDASRAAPDDWDTHWQDFGDTSLGNPATVYRQRLILRCLGEIPTHSNILDIGSGQGELAEILKCRFPNSSTWGIEYSAEGVRRAIASAENLGLSIRYSQRDLLFEDRISPTDQQWATHAVCSEVLEHVDRPDVLLDNARAYLAPDCRLVVTVPGGPRSAFDRHIGHRRHFSASLLRQTLHQAGFQIIRIDRAGVPFFNLYRLTVMLRGQALIRDVSRSRDASEDSKAIALAYSIFGAAFRLNLPSSPFGWQLVAVAKPDRL